MSGERLERSTHPDVGAVPEIFAATVAHRSEGTSRTWLAAADPDVAPKSPQSLTYPAQRLRPLGLRRQRRPFLIAVTVGAMQATAIPVMDPLDGTARCREVAETGGTNSKTPQIRSGLLAAIWHHRTDDVPRSQASHHTRGF